MATANAISALEAGAQCVDVTVNGLGERCGLPPLAEVTTALTELIKVNNYWELGILPELSELVNSFSGGVSTVNQPIVGKNAFTHKAGLHVKAVLLEPKSYEAISPEKVHRKRHLVIDKYTGRFALKNKLDSLNLKVNKQILNRILKEIKAQPNIVNWTDKALISLAKTMGIKA